MKNVVFLMLVAICFAALADTPTTSAGDSETRLLVALAELTSAPTGTEYRESPNEKWKEAKTGQKLHEDYELRNRMGGTFEIELYGEAQSDFPDGPTFVTAGDYSGDAEYKDNEGIWRDLPVDERIRALSVRTYRGVHVPLSIESGRTILKPKDIGGGGLLDY